MLNIICGLFGHRRSKWHRKPAAGIWTSKCWICRTPMERVGPGQWRPISELGNRGLRRDSKAPAAAD
jgi:hypothetical protein